MFPVNDAFDAILLGSFFFGLVLSVLLIVVGDLGVDADGDGFLPFNLGVVLAFVAWFGGVGYLARNAAEWPLALALAVGIGGGLVGALAVQRVLHVLVTPKEAELDPADYRLPGTIARVTSSIRAGGVGEIVYEQAGVRQVSAARAAEGRAIPRGVEVVLLESTAGTATVEPAETFFADRDEPRVDRDQVSVGAAGPAMHPEPDDRRR